MPTERQLDKFAVSDTERIAVIGAGYIGLPTAVGFAALGYQVVCADSNERKVQELNHGYVDLREEHLQELVSGAVRKQLLRFVASARDAVRNATVVFVCVPTPQAKNGSADISAVESVVSEIATVLPAGAIVATRSTVPVGTTERLSRLLRRSDVSVASNPEFLREGTAVQDFFEPDRILIGCSNPDAGARLAKLYSVLDAPVVVTDVRTAELTKYASNAYLATRLSFVNSMARLCDATGSNVHQMMKVLGLDPRIGQKFLKVGPGWGGSCLPKDTMALLATAREFGEPFLQLESTIRTNDQHFDYVVSRVEELAGGSLTGTKVAVWGLAFKAGTSDLRDSPSLEIVRRMMDRGACVVAHDPAVGEDTTEALGINYAGTPVAACAAASVLVVLTEWREYAEIDPSEVAAVMDRPVVFDTRSVLSADGWSLAGAHLESLGAASRSFVRSNPNVSAA